MFETTDLIERYRVPDRARPHLRVNFISSLDGAATVDGLSGPLNDDWDLQVFTVLRRLADVVLVGAGTLRNEGYDGLRVDDASVQWRREQGLADHPRLAIASRSLQLNPDSALLADAPQPPLIFTPETSLGRAAAGLDRVADIIPAGAADVDLSEVVGYLAGAGYPQVLCEGGPQLLGSLIEADMVDELCLTIAPMLIGGPGPRISATTTQAFRRLQLVHALPGGPMLFLRYERSTPQ